MGLTWSFASKDKNFYNFSHFFFPRIYFNTIHHGSFVFCVLSSQRVTLKSRKDKETKNMQETQKQKMTKKTMTTQHNTLPVQEVLITKSRENFSPHFLA